jgi:hypothetical protein
MLESNLCNCNEVQSIRHITDKCPATKFGRGIEQLHKGGPDAQSWLSKLQITL